jgi:predicted lipoprotein
MEYKVIDYFQVGSLKLDKGQIITISEYDEYRDQIKVKHYPDKKQLAGKQVAETFLKLKKIERY